jgi:hypothetical protein
LPMLLKSSDSIFSTHLIRHQKVSILCQTCGIEHSIAPNELDTSLSSKKISDMQNEAKQSCQNLDALLTKIELLLQNPYTFTYELISYWKNAIQLKGEEEAVLDEKTHRIINKLDNKLNSKCRAHFTNSEYLMSKENLKSKTAMGRRELKMWMTTMVEDDLEWNRIKSESEKTIDYFENSLDQFKIGLFPRIFLQLRNEIQHDFGEFKFDQSNFEFG